MTSFWQIKEHYFIIDHYSTLIFLHEIDSRPYSCWFDDIEMRQWRDQGISNFPECDTSQTNEFFHGQCKCIFSPSKHFQFDFYSLLMFNKKNCQWSLPIKDGSNESSVRQSFPLIWFRVHYSLKWSILFIFVLFTTQFKFKMKKQSMVVVLGIRTR